NIANDDSPLVFFFQGGWNSRSFIVLDTTKMKIISIKLQERMNNSTYHYYFVGGVQGGEITVRRETRTRVGDDLEFTFGIFKAKFPEALKRFERAALARDNPEKLKREEDDRRFAKVDQKMMNEEMNQMRLKIDKLEKDKLELKGEVNEMKGKLDESNGKYKKLLMMFGRNK
ncbi:hypothetical protein PFISCL1PPCAC_17017, partial [Pristionchus fissidentatus]